MLASVYIHHAQYNRNEERWGEAAALVQRAIRSLPRQEETPEIAVRIRLWLC